VTRRACAALAALVPLVLVLLGVTPASAAITTGSWVSPASGSRVSGTVPLDFSTSTTDVTLLADARPLPTTLANGHATARWETAGLPNDSNHVLTARECDAVAGCANSNISALVYNPPPGFSLAPESRVAPGAGLDVLGSGVVNVTVMDRNATVTYIDEGRVALPHHVMLPRTFPVGETPITVHAVYCGTQCSGATSDLPLTVVAVDRTPPVIGLLTAPRLFHPVRDGFADDFSVRATLNEPGSARIVVSQGKRVIRRGPLVFTDSTYPLVLSSGTGLKPGGYDYKVEAIDTAGNRAAPRFGHIVGDAKRLVTRTRTITLAPTDTPGGDGSGSCSSAVPAGKNVVLRSNSKCQGAPNTGQDAAVAVFFPSVGNPAKVQSLTLSVDASGSGPAAVLVFQGGTTTVDASRRLAQGRTFFSLPTGVLSPTRHQLQFAVGAISGASWTLTRFRSGITELILR